MPPIYAACSDVVHGNGRRDQREMVENGYKAASLDVTLSKRAAGLSPKLNSAKAHWQVAFDCRENPVRQILECPQHPANLDAEGPLRTRDRSGLRLQPQHSGNALCSGR